MNKLQRHPDDTVIGTCIVNLMEALYEHALTIKDAHDLLELSRQVYQILDTEGFI